MKKVMLSLAIIATIGLVSCKNEEKKEATKTEQTTTNKVASVTAQFGVRGNCGMCKNTIETAVKNLEGITEATWDKEKKQIKVSYSESKTNLDAIHNAIATSGYDTDKVMGNESAYKNLPMCCQYDHSMEMSLKEGDKSEATH